VECLPLRLTLGVVGDVGEGRRGGARVWGASAALSMATGEVNVGGETLSVAMGWSSSVGDDGRGERGEGTTSGSVDGP
jgi:hypothetical protein